MPDSSAPVSSPDLTTVLHDATTIAVVGCSARSSRTSHQIAAYLQRHGYRIVPVNPNHDEILGEPCASSLLEVPDDAAVDIVNIFRRPEHTAAMVRDAARYAETTGATPVVWTQLGVSSPEAQQTAADAGLPYVRNRCIKVEHAQRI
jgi:hypothetical protein